MMHSINLFLSVSPHLFFAFFVFRLGSQTRQTSRKCWMLSSRWTWTKWTSKPLTSLELQTVGKAAPACDGRLESWTSFTGRWRVFHLTCLQKNCSYILVATLDSKTPQTIPHSGLLHLLLMLHLSSSPGSRPSKLRASYCPRSVPSPTLVAWARSSWIEWSCSDL